jgi:hypothetical protein
MLIMNCKKYTSKAVYQKKTWLKSIPSYLLYYHVIGDEMLNELYNIVEKNIKRLLRSKMSALIILIGPLFLIVLLGLAFNNSTEQSDHMVLKEDSEIKIKIVRGPAVAYADNDEVEIPLEDGDIIEIKKSKDMARIIKII